MDTEHDRDLGAAVAAVLRGERAAQRMSFDELAERAGVDKSTALRMLNGRREMRLSQLAAFARALSMDPADVMRAAETRLDEGLL